MSVLARFRSLATALGHMALLLAGCVAGAGAWIGTQVSATDYWSLMTMVASLAAVSIVAAWASSRWVGGPIRWVPAGFAAAGTLSTLDMAARLIL